MLRAADAATDLHEYAGLMLAQVCAGVGAPAGLVAVVRDEMVHVVASQGVSGTALVRFPAAIDDDQPVCRVVAEADAVWLDGRAAPAGGELPSAVGCVPLRWHGDVVGVVAVGHYEPHRFDAVERAFLGAVAGGVAPTVTSLLASGDEARDAVTGVASQLPAFLRAVSVGLSGDTVTFDQVDLDSATVTPLLQHEANANVADEVAGLLGVAQPIASTVHEQVVAADAPVFVADGLDEHRDPVELPDGWRRVVERFPVHGLIAVPVRLDGRPVGVLVAGRRRRGLPYTPSDLEFVLTSANRLEGMLRQGRMRLVEDRSAPSRTQTGGVEPERAERPERREAVALEGRFTSSVSWPASIAVGIAVPALVTLLLLQVDDPLNLRPASMLLAVLVALTIVVGFRAGLVAALTGVVGLGVFLTEPYSSFSIRSWGEAFGVLTFAIVSVGVLFLVEVLRRERNAAGRDRTITSALLDGSPVGLALLDRDLRVVDVNASLSELTGEPRDAHLGLRPTEVSELAGPYEADLRAVVESGRRLHDVPISFVEPGTNTERHWRADYFPVHDLDDRVIGVGVSVEDVTGVTIARHRSELLLELSTALAAVGDEDDFAAQVNAFLAQALGGRAVVALVEEDRTSLRLLRRPADPGAEPPVSSLPASLPLTTPLALTDAVRSDEVIEVPDPAVAVARYPTTTALRAELGDEASVTVPLHDPFRSEVVVGAIQVYWPRPREITPTTRTLLGTIGSMAELALSRIQVAEAIEQTRFRTVLDAMPDSVVLAQAVRDADGRIVDFVVEYANTAGDGAGRPAAELFGRQISELYPGWLDTPHFPMFVEVVETGRPLSLEREHFQAGLRDGRPVGGYWNVQVAPFGPNGYISSTRDVTDIVLAEAAARDAAEVEQREREAVELLQRAALPEQLPALDGVALGAVYQPAASQRAVGGDWYDAFEIDDHQLALVIADVAGHGTEAAAFMVQVRNIFRAVAVEHRTPAAVLSRVNDVVLRLRPGGLFVTCCYAVLDTASRELSWAVAGHPPPVVVAAGDATLASARPAPPLALFADARYHVASTALGPGDRVYLYTDGLVERRGEHLDESLDRLRHQVTDVASLAPQDAVDALARSVEGQLDDLAVLCAAVL